MSGTSLKLPKMSLFSKKKTNNFLLDHMIELLLVAIIIVLSFVEPAFLRPSNLLNVLRNSAMKGVIAYGMCLVMIAGEIDLSVGSQVDRQDFECGQRHSPGVRRPHRPGGRRGSGHAPGRVPRLVPPQVRDALLYRHPGHAEHHVRPGGHHLRRLPHHRLLS